jgi:hypothetical protein
VSDEKAVDPKQDNEYQHSDIPQQLGIGRLLSIPEITSDEPITVAARSEA